VRLFADDCLVYRAIRSVKDQLILQADLIALEKWSVTWGMSFNPTKCNIMRTTRGLGLQKFYTLHGQILAEVSAAKYLGVLVCNDLKWSKHIASVVSKASQKLGFIRRNLRRCPLSSKAIAYISLVRSGMEYAGIVWNPYLKTDIDCLERVQRKAARWVKSAFSTTTSVTSIMSDMGWNSLQERRRIQSLVFLYKIINNSETALSCSDFNLLAARPTRNPDINPNKLFRPRANLKQSELCKQFVFRTIPQWNDLPSTHFPASSVSSFKKSLAAAPKP
jgi:hypothetical protein